MDLELYKKIVDEVAQYPHATVRLHSVGEPLMWKGLEQLPDYHQRSVKSWIFTSAVTSDKTLLKLICENIDIIEVSVNSTTPEDYRNTKGVNAFELVCENIQYMRHFIQKKGLNTRLIASRVQSNDKQKDEDFIQYWKSTGWVKDAFIRSYHTYNDLLDKLEDVDPAQKHEACLVHWSRFNISLDGYAVVCFNELFKDSIHPALIYGNVKHQTIAEIWQGESLTSLRAAELSLDYSRCSMNDHLPCRNCTSCQPLLGNRQTSEHQIELLMARHA